MPNPRKGESSKAFMARFMGSHEADEDFPDPKQRAAVAYSKLRKRKKMRHEDEAEDEALIKREVKASALKKR